MKYRYVLIWVSFFFSFSAAYSQPSQWPVQMQANSGATIKVYEPQPSSFSNNLLKLRSAISVLNPNQQDPVFGVIWADVQLDKNGDQLSWREVSITSIKLPGEINDDELNGLKAALETGLPAKNISISASALNDQLNASKKEDQLSSNLSTRPPKIIYTKRPSLLVTIDGQPQLQQNPDWGVEQVVNTPFTIIKSDGQYYLYGEKKWYRGSSPLGPWSYTERLPSSLSKINEDVQANDTTGGNYMDYTVPDVMVSTEPAELIQSNGDANFSPIEGTDLLYMTNTVNDIFMDVNSQQYYVLVSGRWYRSSNLSGNWNYVPASSLPQDFARIPEGSPKDAVLSNVAGTDASREALMDAQLPQTAKVDRRTATADITYDGDPRFEDISGTRLRYAVNTPATVLNLGRDYYAVQNGVWFESGSPYGPWTVATHRPDEVNYIPPSYPVYNTKYVYIYDVTPDWVYMGYTPGYLGTYVYGPTIFYGTGYYYRPWRGRYYYPRPITWGYNMRYNPWYGWSFGINLHFGWFHIGVGSRYQSPFWGCWGGWFGPTVYYPTYYYRPINYYGSRGNGYGPNHYRTNSYSIYTNRRGVVTYERPPYAYNRNISRPGSPNGGRYYNPYGYNNTNRSAQGNRFPGRATDPAGGNGGRLPRNQGNRIGGNQQPNGGFNNRPSDNNRTPDGRTPGNFGNNRFPNQQQNGGVNGGRFGNDRTTPGNNRTPGNVDGNRNNGNGQQSPRQYQQPQQQIPNNNGGSRNPVYSDRGGFERQPQREPSQNNFPSPGTRVERQQAPVREQRQADPGFGQPQQRTERMQVPRQENSNRPSGRESGGGNNGGGRPQERPERGGGGRRGG
ncbi:MAG: hypothetical protein INR73_16930 [Williamsia sp.]|nr:hypothetical protein [Williamsia sp.]